MSHKSGDCLLYNVYSIYYIDTNKTFSKKKLKYIHKYLFIEHSRSCLVRFTSEKYRSVSKLELDTNRQLTTTRIDTYRIVLLENIGITL